MVWDMYYIQDNHLIQAGSRSLNDAETRYAVIELKATAVAWAIKQCRHYLLECPSSLVQTDLRPLVSIFKKELASIDNVRLSRIRESLLGYNLQVEYLAGKKNIVADALSRFPVAAAVTPADNGDEEEEPDGLPEDPAIANFAKATAEDEELKALAGVIRARLHARPSCLHRIQLVHTQVCSTSSLSHQRASSSWMDIEWLFRNHCVPSSSAVSTPPTPASRRLYYTPGASTSGLT
jgi:hypothetical protein